MLLVAISLSSQHFDSIFLSLCRFTSILPPSRGDVWLGGGGGGGEDSNIK